MARLAIFVDGGYLDAIARDAGVWVDYQKLSTEVVAAVAAKTPEPIDRLRTYYYHSLPYQSSPPTTDESKRYSQKHRLFEKLRYLDRFEVRLGRLAFRGTDGAGAPIFQQKGVDLLLGLDFALLAGKRQITHAAVIAGDSDLVPAFNVARSEGVSLWLFHGPRYPRNTVAAELFLAADERSELDNAFFSKVAMPPQPRIPLRPLAPPEI